MKPMALYLSYNGQHLVKYVLAHNLEAEKRRILFDEFQKFDFIITQPLGSKFNEISTENLVQCYPQKVVKIHNLFFQGLQPDLFSLPFPVLGHSRIMIWAFLNGKTVEECMRMFSWLWYERIGFFYAWEISMKELVERERNVDVPFVSELEILIRERMAFFTYNHPAAFVILEYLKKINRYIGIDQSFLPSECYKDYLLAETIWPIYPEIGDFHKLSYRGGMMFGRGGTEWIGLNRMIQYSFNVFEKYRYIIDINVKNADEMLYYWQRRSIDG